LAFASSGGSAPAFSVLDAAVSGRGDKDIDLPAPSTCGADEMAGTRPDCRWRPPRRRRRGRPAGPASPAPLTAIGFCEETDGPPAGATASFGGSSPGISPADAPE